MKLKRNPQSIKSRLVIDKNNRVITKVPLTIQVPTRYPDIGLGEVGINTVVYGLFSIVDKQTQEYAVNSANALIEINPSQTGKVLIEEVEYYEFSFDANTVLYNNLNILRRDDILFRLFDEFFFKGKLPWFASYEDVCKLFDTSEEYAGSGVAATHEIIEFLAAMITRSKQDRTIPLRNVLKSYQDLKPENTDYVPLQSVLYSVNSTVNKLTGAYFNDGVTSALVNPTERVETIEGLLRA